MRGRTAFFSGAVASVLTAALGAGIVSAAQIGPARRPASLSTPATAGANITAGATAPPDVPPMQTRATVRASAATPNPAIAVPAQATAAGPPIIASFVGRLLDLQSGFVFFSSGDAFRIAENATRLDVRTKAPFSGDDVTGLYGKAEFSADGLVRVLSIGRRAFPPVESGPSVAQFAVTKSPKTENPELADDGNGFTGAPVLVSFTVTVPPTTPLTGYVYLTTEASRWNPMEIRMDRVDALHYRITRSIASGTKLVYRYTRGTWRSSERGRDGLEGPPRRYVVQNLDVARRDDTVYHWSDESISGAPPISPDAIPTPFNGQPFSKQI